MSKKLRNLLNSLILAVLLATPALAEETISLGLTLTLPSPGDTNWSDSFVTGFAEPISEHQHTGSGDGLQLVTASLADNSVTGAKIRLANNQALRARNAANSADIDLIKLNASNAAEFIADVAFTGSLDLQDVTNFAGTAIGSDLQAWDADLDAISALSKTDGNFIVGNGTAWVAESGATARTSLGLAIGTNVQAWDAQLDTVAALSSDAITKLSDISALAVTDSNVIVGNGTTWVAESGSTARTSLGAAASGANSDITSLTAMTSISRSASGSINIEASDGDLNLDAGGASGDIFFETNSTQQIVLTGNDFKPVTSGGVNLGTTSRPFNGLTVNTMDYRGGTGSSTKAPQTVAPDAWIQIFKAGTTYYIPLYNAS